MKNEKLFKEASSGRCVFKGISHVYVIDNGCKIEYYNDGSLRAYSTSGGSYFYREYDKVEMDRLYEVGFELASLEISIKDLKKNMRKAQERRSFVRHSSYQGVLDLYVGRLCKNSSYEPKD